MDRSPQVDKGLLDDDEAHVKESEKKWANRTGHGFVPSEEIPDPKASSEDEIIEKWYTDSWTNEDYDGLIAKSYEEEADEVEKETHGGVYQSENRNRLPREISQIIRKHSLPPQKWEKLSKEEQKQRKALIQKEIEDYYLSRSKKSPLRFRGNRRKAA